jgi:hypothetical protein
MAPSAGVTRSQLSFAAVYTTESIRQYSVPVPEFFRVKKLSGLSCREKITTGNPVASFPPGFAAGEGAAAPAADVVLLEPVIELVVLGLVVATDEEVEAWLVVVVVAMADVVVLLDVVTELVLLELVLAIDVDVVAMLVVVGALLVDVELLVVVIEVLEELVLLELVLIELVLAIDVDVVAMLVVVGAVLVDVELLVVVIEVLEELVEDKVVGCRLLLVVLLLVAGLLLVVAAGLSEVDVLDRPTGAPLRKPVSGAPASGVCR